MKAEQFLFSVKSSLYSQFELKNLMTELRNPCGFAAAFLPEWSKICVPCLNAYLLRREKTLQPNTGYLNQNAEK